MNKSISYAHTYYYLISSLTVTRSLHFPLIWTTNMKLCIPPHPKLKKNTVCVIT